MSYDTIKSGNARRAREWNKFRVANHDEILADVERGDFLRALDKAAFEVTDFEAEFIESFFENRSLNWWTDNRRKTCDRMRQQYGGRL